MPMDRKPPVPVSPLVTVACGEPPVWNWKMLHEPRKVIAMAGNGSRSAAVTTPRTTRFQGGRNVFGIVDAISLTFLERVRVRLLVPPRGLGSRVRPCDTLLPVLPPAHGRFVLRRREFAAC